METAKEQGVSPKALWLPMLPDEIPAEEKQELSESPLTTYIGELDDPAKQEQYPLFLDLETCGHILVCGSREAEKPLSWRHFFIPW